MDLTAARQRAPLRRRFHVCPGVQAFWILDDLDLVKPHRVDDTATARCICAELETAWIADVARWMEQEWRR